MPAELSRRTWKRLFGLLPYCAVVSFATVALVRWSRAPPPLETAAALPEWVLDLEACRTHERQPWTKRDVCPTSKVARRVWDFLEKRRLADSAKVVAEGILKGAA